MGEPIVRLAGKVIFRGILFPTYLIYKPIKIRIQKVISPTASVWTAFITRYVVHGFIAFLILFVTAQNIFAKENGNILESNSIISQVLGNSGDYEVVTDQNSAIDQSTAGQAPAPHSLLGMGSETALSIAKTATAQTSDNATLNQGTDEITGALNPETANNVNNTGSEAVRTTTEEYAVQEGDTISIIAQKFGVSVNTILWANNLTGRSLIRPGDKLTILPISGVLHKVKSGDTLAKIATRYNADSEKIIEFNRLVSADDINIEENLIIPDGVMPESPKPAPQPVQQKHNVFAIHLPDLFIPPPPVKVAAGARLLWPTVYHKINQYFRGWLHTGLDIDCNYGIANIAAADGVVTTAGWLRGYGYAVIINHGNGMETLYGHHQKLLVSAGQRISRGQPVGMCGSTGHSTGTHLHFEVIIGGKRVNPLEYL